MSAIASNAEPDDAQGIAEAIKKHRELTAHGSYNDVIMQHGLSRGLITTKEYQEYILANWTKKLGIVANFATKLIAAEKRRTEERAISDPGATPAPCAPPPDQTRRATARQSDPLWQEVSFAQLADASQAREQRASAQGSLQRRDRFDCLARFPLLLAWSASLLFVFLKARKS